jgi:disulfide bond formation protein DsbB
MMFFIGLIAAFAASLSFYREFGLNHSPCLLCAIQRTLWLGLLFTAIFSTLFKPFAKRLIPLLLALNLSVASYHTLVQLKIIEDRCKTDLQIQNKDAYAAILKKGGAVGCAEDSWRIAKIPAPALNGVVCLALLIWHRRNWSFFAPNSFSSL